jgi:HEAT repeat protein
MTDLDTQIASYLAKLDGPESGDVWFRLLEYGSAAVPSLEEALRAASSPRVKAQIVELLWQTREPLVVGSLAEALNDPAPEVWKAALDGLVSIRDASASRVLRETLVASERGAHHVPADWLREALEQHDAHQ